MSLVCSAKYGACNIRGSPLFTVMCFTVKAMGSSNVFHFVFLPFMLMYTDQCGVVLFSSFVLSDGGCESVIMCVEQLAVHPCCAHESISVSKLLHCPY